MNASLRLNILGFACEDFRMLTPLLIALTLTPAVKATVDDETKTAKTLRIEARTLWRAPTKPGSPAQQIVIRSAADAAKATGKSEKEGTATLARAFKVKDIDWTKKMVVVVTSGAKGTGGYTLTVDKLAVKDNSLTVHWTLKSPTGAATSAFTHPGQAVLTETVDGKVEFSRTEPKGKGK